MKRFPGIALLALIVAGCAGEPYVLVANEYDRTSDAFRKTPKDLALVAICYSRGSTPPETLQQLADAECGKVQKVARYRGGRYFDCPLLQPASAQFVCVQP